MNIHWHAMAEQLQQHPDLVEEELQGEIAAMSAKAELQSEPVKELEVLQRLQARLGNHGLQQLLSGAPGAAAPDRKQVPTAQVSAAPVPAAAPASSAGKAVAATSPEPEQKAAASEETAAATTPDPAPEIPVSATEVEQTPELAIEPAAEPKVATALEPVPEPAPAPTPTPVAVDPREQLQVYLRRLLARLPHLDVTVVTPLAALFDQQSPSMQAKVIATLVARCRALPAPQQEKMVAAIRKLSGAVAKSQFIAILLVRLVALLPSPPAPVVVDPAPPEA